MASNIINVLNSTSSLLINNISSQAINIGNGGGLTTIVNGLTSNGTNTLSNLTGGTATFSSTVTTSGLLTCNNGITSTTSTNTLGVISGGSATFSSTVSVSGLLTATNGITSTTSSNTFGVTTFNGLLTASNGITSTLGTNTLKNTTFVSSSTIDLGGNVITNSGSPVNGTDLITKNYLDLVSQGFYPKTPVRVSTTTFQVLITDFAAGSTIDSIVLVLGNRILIKDQINAIENGIYIVTAGIPTRSADFAVGSSQSGATVFVTEGTVNSDLGFICSSISGSDVVGTDNITFLQFTGAGQIIAGVGLTKTGNILDVDAIQTQITSVGTLSSLIVSTGGLTSSTSNTLGPCTLSGNINMQSNKIINLGTPTLNTDAVTKLYADTVYYTSNFKQTVKVASVGALTLSSFTDGATIDTITLATGDRILIKDQTNAVENGIYIITNSSPIRSPDLFTGASASGSIVFILSGSTYQLNYFECTNVLGSDVVGTDNLVFMQAVSTIIAGTGLTKTLNTLSVNASQTQITSIGTLSSLSVSGSSTLNTITSNGVNITPNTDDLPGQLSFSGANNVNTPTNIIGLTVSYTNSRAFKALVSVTILATTNIYALYEIVGIQGDSGFTSFIENWGTVSTGITFTITNSGQVQYTSSNYSGFISLTLKFKIETLTL